MKRGNFTSLMVLSGALAFPAYAEKVQFEQLPADLQEKIRAQAGSNRIEDIDRETRNGRTIYEVAFKENGQHREIQIEHNDASGSAPGSTSASSAVGSQKIPYEQLPDNVKRVADAQLQGAEVNDVDRQTKNGQTTYEIGFKRNDGAQQELLISQEGQVLRGGSAAVAGSTSPDAVNRPYRNARGVPTGQSSGSANVRAMDYEQLPPAVRSVADSRLSDGDVSLVNRMIQNGQVSYQIDFKKEDGRNQQLVIAEDGRVIRDQFVNASAVGAPGSIQRGSSSSSTATSSNAQNLTAPAQLLSAQEITHSQLPVGVARVVRGYTTTGNIQDIHRGTWNGQEVYQVSYRDNNNQMVRVQLDANGQVIYDPQTANSGSSTQNLLNNIGRALFDNNGN